ncbi:MAG: type II toxin-antitoxin system YafQ family toxin [Desulfovibrio sp.]|nr:type II toxin-antitoxin system YafQ family toxin [Desulfovibrio sp.]
MSELEEVISLICSENPLPEKYKDHQLKHSWKDSRVAYFSRTGTHSELFGK